MRLKPKDFNFQEFMLRSGERAGLAVAGAVGGLLLLIGLFNWISSGSNSSHAEELKKEADRQSQAMRSAAPPADLDKVDPNLGAQREEDRVDAANYPMAYQLVNSKPVEDNKRRSPRILPVESWEAEAAFVPLRILNVRHIQDGDFVEVVVGGGGGKTGKEDSDRFRQFPKVPGMGSGSPGPGGGAPGPGGTGAPPGAGGRFVPPGAPGYGGPGGGGTGQPKKGTIVVKPRDEVQADDRLLEYIYPTSMIVVAGAFPYRQQLEEFQRKLRYVTLDEYLEKEGQPQFKEMKFQRRVIHANGEATEWQPYDIGSLIQELIVKTNLKVEPDSDKLQYVRATGLVAPRPKLFKDDANAKDSHYAKAEYPKVEEKLTTLMRAIKTLTDRTDPKAVAKASAPTITPKSKVNPFDPTGVAVVPENKDGGSMGPGQQFVVPGKTGVSREDQLPSYLLVRFLDPEVQPGETYEYQVKFVLANPNYKKTNVVSDSLTKKEDIESDWFTVTKDGQPYRVTVPPSLHYYAVNEKAQRGVTPDVPPGEVFLQIHKWVVDFQAIPDKNDPSARKAVGDWLVQERLAVHRGEWADRVVPMEVPVYDGVENEFALFADPKNHLNKRANILMGPDHDHMLLVDFEGGKTSYTRPGADDKNKINAKAPTEVLLLMPDGKLSAHEEDRDTDDPERKARVQTHRDRILSFYQKKP